MTSTEYPIITFKTINEWENWLAQHHAKAPGIWIQLFKKESGINSPPRSEILDIALCYGWIDGQAKSYDKKSWLQKFTPRRPRSIWSKRNTEHVERLIKQGKMKPAGYAEIEKAKADGRWEKAYDAPSTMTIPEDFLIALSKNKKAKDFFEKLNKTNMYAIVWRLQTAKKPETKIKRMNAILAMLSKGEKFHP